jgi:hypothetical protein
VLSPSLTAAIGAAFSSKQAPAAHLAYTITTAPVLETKAPRTPPAGYQEFRSEFYKFQLFYPDDFEVKEYKGKESTAIYTFKAADGHSFEIFIVPYGDPQISKERFQMDEPSGILENMSTTTIDGVVAAFFNGRNASMGDTAEVWFIGRGFLYEVTTYKELAPWLSQLLATWQFL